MWKFASNCIGSGIRGGNLKINEKATECTDDDDDDEISSNCSSRVGEDEGLECPICWEYFNIVENVPYVLWCGHSVCKNCILGLQWGAIIKFLPLQLPLFISCPWCNYLSPRLIYKGNLKFPCKNYFLLSMVESRNSQRVKSHSSFFCHHDNYCPSREQQYNHMSVNCYDLERLVQYNCSG
ncbi:uncharacterized protein LOC124915382 isoform X2 [Impatiens glandulifera]|uniref:uncharacterized protein LOC124915382 isoform X2 n=1 Tax=Impatiens glandulifera TaxID=253017 RepID=UPI001FB182E7|nr:uncharacterized protein LOC124915382 isoform X2 [Impatiens glandulifera]